MVTTGRNTSVTVVRFALRVTAGVVFNPVNVVLLAMDFKRRMLQTAPTPYSPSVFEWGISVGLTAATVFLFGLAACHVPVLAKPGQVQGA